MPDSLQINTSDSLIVIKPTEKNDSVTLQLQAKPIVKRTVPVSKKKEEIKTEIEVIENPYTLTDSNGFSELSLQLRRDNNASVARKVSPVILNNTEHVSKAFNVIERPTQFYETNYGVIGIALLVLFSIHFIRIYAQQIILSVLNGAVNIQISDRLLREKNIIVRRSFIAINSLSVIILSFFIWQLLNYYNINVLYGGFFSEYGFILLFLSGFLVLRYVVLKLLGSLFLSQTIIDDFLHINYILTKSLSIFLFPIVIFAYFSKNFMHDAFIVSGVILAIAYILLRFFRGIQIILKHRVLIFYSFLYFCTLEILPVLVGVKYVMSLE